jgi:NDP-hexose-3-ketoreductase
MKSTKSPADAGALVKTSAPVRVGVLGCSDIARRKFIPALENCSNACLGAVSSRSRGKAAELLPEIHCPILTHEELLLDTSIDLVYLSLPNHLHEEWSIRTLDAGKHLVCEKPLSTSFASAEKILDCAARNNRLIYENQMFLFHPQHETVTSLIESGRIGRVVALRAFFGFPLPKTGDFRLDPDQGGGAFHDLARYPLGIAAHLLKGVLQGFRGQSLWHDGLNTAVHGTALTDADELFSFSIVFGQQYESFYEIVGDSGKIRLERAFTTPHDYSNRVILTEGSRVTEIPVPPANHFQLMIESISDIIRTGTDYSFLNRRAALIARLADDMERGCIYNE